jgi:transposase InsO family protein
LKDIFDIKILCAIAKVSVSGYYKYKKRVELKQTKEDKEWGDCENIKEICFKYKRKYWYRTVTMKLRQNGVIFNHKKVLRLMKKYDLLSIIRKKDPYSKIRKATREHSTAQNILKREFQWLLPFKKLWTDISYLRYKGKWIYFSIIKDMISWEILSNQISDNLEITVVQESLKDLNCLRLEWALIHSDQWFHYTHPSFSLWVKKLGCIQSMSRRWNCIDNAPTESFFGHMKDEIDISWCSTLEEVKIYMNNYIFEYNNERPQWHRKKMTPVQYRNHLLSLTS